VDFDVTSVTDQMFYIHQILQKRYEYNGKVHHIFTDFKKTCDSGGKYCTTSSL